MPIAPAAEANSTAVPVPGALSQQRVLALLLVAVSVALVWILLPFYGSVLWGAIIALLFTPMYCWLLPRLRGRRSLAALLTITVATLIVVLPAVLVSGALAREARQGVRGVLLWAALMAVLSLLPVVGASLVWLPVAVGLFVTGSPWQAVGLVVFGVLVIGLVDNVLRPILIGHETGLPDYLVLITTFGGIAVLGMNGFVVGPTIAAMFVAVWHIQTATRFAPSPGRAAEPVVQPSKALQEHP